MLKKTTEPLWVSRLIVTPELLIRRGGEPSEAPRTRLLITPPNDIVNSINPMLKAIKHASLCYELSRLTPYVLLKTFERTRCAWVLKRILKKWWQSSAPL